MGTVLAIPHSNQLPVYGLGKQYRMAQVLGLLGLYGDIPGSWLQITLAMPVEALCLFLSLYVIFMLNK